MATPQVGLIMGSKSDWDTMKAAAEVLDALGVRTKPRSSPRTAPPSASTITPPAPSHAG